MQQVSCAVGVHVLTRGRTHPPLPRQRAQLLILVFHPPFFSSNTLTYKVYDGENTSSRLLGNFTRDGMMGHVINSTSNRLWVEFNSNASGTNQGFRLTYTSELSSDGQLRVISAGVLFFFFFPPLADVSFSQVLTKNAEVLHSLSPSALHHRHQKKRQWSGSL